MIFKILQPNIFTVNSGCPLTNPFPKKSGHAKTCLTTRYISAKRLSDHCILLLLTFYLMSQLLWNWGYCLSTHDGHIENSNNNNNVLFYKLLPLTVMVPISAVVTNHLTKWRWMWLDVIFSKCKFFQFSSWKHFLLGSYWVTGKTVKSTSMYGRESLVNCVILERVSSWVFVPQSYIILKINVRSSGEHTDFFSGTLHLNQSISLLVNILHRARCCASQCF